eukprot:g19111.t1
MVHVRDMARLVRQVSLTAEGINPLEATPYFLAVDQPPSAVLQKDLVQGIVDEMGEHYEVPRAMKVEEPERLELREALALDLNLEPSALALAEDFCANCDPPGWVCKEGLSANLRSIADEFCAGKKLRCMRILVAGPPASGKSNLAKAVAEHFKVPYLTFPVPIESADVEKMATQITSNVCRYRGYVLDAGGIGFAEAEKLFRFDVEVPKSEGDEVDPVEEEGAEPAPPKIERRLNEETCPAYVIITQAPAALCKGKWQNAGGSSLETFEKTMQAYIDNNLTSDIHSLQDFFQDVASKGVLNLPIAGKDPDDLFESARIYIESSGRPFNYLPTEDEVSQEIRQQRLEQLERLAAELAAAQEQRLHELRLQRVAEHEAAQKKLAQMPLREYLMKYMVPNLTEGLIEVCKVLPDNPVDYLANYLEEHAATTPGDTRLFPPAAEIDVNRLGSLLEGREDLVRILQNAFHEEPLARRASDGRWHGRVHPSADITQLTGFHLAEVALQELLQVLLQSANSRHIHWLHFPKAGTSFLATIWNFACGQRIPLDLAVSPRAVPGCEQCYDVALLDRYPAETYCEDRGDLLSVDGYLSEDFSTQHKPVTALDMRQKDWSVVGLFRRPSQRLISAFYDNLHASGMSGDEFSDLWQACGAKGENSAACYARYPGDLTEGRVSIAGCTARMLTGGSCAESAADRSLLSSFDGGKARLEEALKMEMTFLGLTEEWDLSVCLFHRMFGGSVSAAQLVDFHQGSLHQDAWAEKGLAQLAGFIDEVDEEIYEAASKRFHELLRLHVGDLNICDTLVQQATRMTEEPAGTAVQSACDCASIGRQCGVSQGLSCGQCPGKRLDFDGEPAAVGWVGSRCGGSGWMCR